MNWAFLLTIFVLVYTSAGQSVTLNMSSYSALNSRDMRITCEFQTDDLFTIIRLLNGKENNNNLEAIYVIAKNQFEIPGGTSVRLEVEPSTTVAGGSLTFVFSRVTCLDFTWYVCRGSGSTSGVDVDSSNITLQISPGIDSIMKTSPSELVVKQISYFVCRGTVQKEGYFNIKWYRASTEDFSLFEFKPAKVISQNECSRVVTSSLRYTVIKRDVPNLVLWCRIQQFGQKFDKIDKMANFSVQDLPVTLNMPSYSTLNSTDMRITCKFQTDDQFTIIRLLNGNKDLVATYTFTQQTFKMVTDSSVRLEVGSGTTYRNGSLTFVFSRVTCPDFTWYVCRGSGSTSGLTVDSTNITLQMSPRIDSLMKTLPFELVVNQISEFVCRGTIRKGGDSSVNWYRTNVTGSNHIYHDYRTIVVQNECTSTVSSSIKYTVRKTDVPYLALCCHIMGEQTSCKMVNFTVQGAAVILKMPSYAALNSVNLRITCEFPNGDQLGKLKLLSGNKATEVTYLVASDKFEISSDTFVSLEFNSDGSTQRGSVTFVLSRVACHDFTWYMCRWIVAQNGLTADSKNITLQALPAIDNLMKTSSRLVSNEIFNFTCKGSIQKEGPFTVQWYRKYLTSSRQLQVDQAKIIGQNECNRSIISSFTYKLRDGDEPNLILYCRIESGKIVVQKKETFTVQGCQKGSSEPCVGG